MEVAQYSGRIASVLWGCTFSTVKVVQYSGGKHQYMRGITSVLWRDSFSTVGDNSSTCGGTLVLWRVFRTLGEDFNSACLAIKNDEKISICQFVL